MIDPLTGLHNRRYAMPRLAAIADRGRVRRHALRRHGGGSRPVQVGERPLRPCRRRCRAGRGGAPAAANLPATATFWPASAAKNSCWSCPTPIWPRRERLAERALPRRRSRAGAPARRLVDRRHRVDRAGRRSPRAQRRPRNRRGPRRPRAAGSEIRRAQSGDGRPQRRLTAPVSRPFAVVRLLPMRPAPQRGFQPVGKGQPLASVIASMRSASRSCPSFICPVSRSACAAKAARSAAGSKGSARSAASTPAMSCRIVSRRSRKSRTAVDEGPPQRAAVLRRSAPR